MKKVAAGVFTLFIAVSLNAQNPEQGKEKMTPEERSDEMTSKMITSLELTDEQAAQVAEINLKTSQDMQPIEEQMKALREERKKLKKQRNVELKKVLSEEQFKKCKEQQKAHKLERKQKMKGQRKPGKHAAPEVIEEER